MVVVELVWIGQLLIEISNDKPLFKLYLFLGLLWVLWLAVGGTIASVPWLNYCSSLSYYCVYQIWLSRLLALI